ncbi:MAG: hypothetical protein H6898_04875 [Rhodobacter sp.]|nr:hypothetical protein [Paracoccaceae bacterium]MCC0075904.1 hypothetical protein [Rhodobacter sp.]
MRPTLVLDILLLAPLGLALFATAQLLAPVRRAFARRAPELPLLPGETVIATLRPDSRVLIVPGLALLLPLSTSDPASALGLAFGPFVITGLCWLVMESRQHWVLTDRRIITADGASQPLTGIARIARAPGFLALDGAGTRRLCLYGVVDSAAAARLIRAAILPLRQ